MANETVFTRYAGNPIVTAATVPRANSIHNSAFNDNLGIGVMRAAHSRRLRIPEDISIVGFDDSVEASLVAPALTSVRQPLKEMGWMAVALLARLMHGPTAEALTVELATRLVVRDSTTNLT
jgi:LacI family transcriptional regulator